jgi:hypothetical protein
MQTNEIDLTTATVVKLPKEFTENYKENIEDNCIYVYPTDSEHAFVPRVCYFVIRQHIIVSR